MDQFERTRRLLGDGAMDRLSASRVAVFGVGGVGGHAAEALARSGVGAIELFDDDRVSLTNLNRQIVATHATLGRYKADAMAERLRDISPDAEIVAHRMFYMPQNAGEVDLSRFDYVVDAVDTVAAKLELAERATRLGVPVICALGAGNRLDPTRLRVADLYETSGCPLARVMRREARRRGVERLKVVFSSEPAIQPLPPREGAEEGVHAARRAVPASNAFVPAAMGLLLAREVVCDLTRTQRAAEGRP